MGVGVPLLLGLLVGLAEAFYLPGVTPVEYPTGSLVRVKVNSITSTKTAIPYDYYSLPFCMPYKKNPKAQVCQVAYSASACRILSRNFFTAPPTVCR